jgi:hypothetical protein
MEMTASAPRFTGTDLSLLRRLEPEHLLAVVTALAEDGWSAGNKTLGGFRAMPEYQPGYCAPSPPQFLRKQQTSRENPQ